jgi:hypothetical protein
MHDFQHLFGDFDTEQYVYHYTSTETAIRHILQSTTLRLGPLATVNDPRESRLLGFTYLPKEMLKPGLLSGDASFYHLKNLSHRNITDKASALLAKRIKIACFARDTKSVTLDDPGYYRGYTRPAMWAYYGSNHTGVCLVFDRSQLIASILDQIGSLGHLHFGNMRYPRSGATKRDLRAFNLDLHEIATSTLEHYIERKFQGFHAELCLRKHPDWRLENEWRCLSTVLTTISNM